MTRLSRRGLLKLGAAGLAGSALPSFASAADKAAAEELQPAPSPPVVFKYAELGKTTPVASKDIAASPLGVGFECLDRMMFDPRRAYFAYQCLCPLFDAQTAIDDAPVDVLQTTLASEQRGMIHASRFVRNGKAIVAVWFPSELPNPYTPQTVSLGLRIDDRATIGEPVLIDPLSQRVFQLDGAKVETKRLTLAGLPLADYPLLITDRCVALA